jgi:RNA polymerase sigma factor (sigma-70 family)
MDCNFDNLTGSTGLTFEQLRPALHKWARFYSNRDFEHWELINAVWEKGSVQKLPHIKLASQRIKYDMIDYMRRETDSRNKRNREKSGKFYPQKIRLSVMVDDEGEPLTVRALGAAGDKSFEREDFFQYITKDLSRKEQLVLNLRYKKDYEFWEIAKIVGVCESTARSIHYYALKKIEWELSRTGEVLHKRSAKIAKKKNNYAYVSRYNSMYYQKNRVRIQKQRAQKKSA